MNRHADAAIEFKACIVLSTLVMLIFVSTASSAVSQTPPMGWNSYDCFNFTVTEAEVKANADYMAENLKEYGWEYICVDWAWYYSGSHNNSPNQDANFSPSVHYDNYGRMLPDPTRFPSSANGQGFKPLADYIHGKGLKFGVHLMRGIPRQAVSENTPIMGTNYRANEIVDRVNLCAWLNLMYGLNMSRPGAQEYLNSLFELYASWGVDFVKVDDLINPYGSPAYRESEVTAYKIAIENSGREMVLSTSPGATPLANATQIKRDANQWRMANDLWDNWNNLNAMFDLTASWYTHAGPGHWPDADMIPIGRLSKRGPVGAERWSGLTSDERYTMMTLWIIARSPLMWGGNMVENRAEELRLMQNSEAIAVNQKSANSRPVVNGNTPVWCADIPGTNEKYVAVFNRNSSSRDVSVKFSEIGLTGTVLVRDLWAKSDKGSFTNSFSISVPSHGSFLFKMTGEPPEPRSAFSKIEAESYIFQSGIQNESCSEGGECIAYIENEDYCVYSNIDFESGAAGFEVRVSSATTGGNIEIRLDSISGELAGTCQIASTGSWEAWALSSCSLKEVSGKHDLYLKFTGEDDYLFNINWMQFTRGEVAVGQRSVRQGIGRYRTGISNGKIIITPSGDFVRFTVSIFTPDGRLVTGRNDRGRVEIPVSSRGIYLVDINCNGYIERKLVSFY